VLRDFVTGEPATTLPVFGRLLTSRFPELHAAAWSVTRMAPQRLSVPAGKYTGIAIELQRDETRMTFVFDALSPHTLLAYDDTQGNAYRLAKVERMAYWRMSKPGDEAWYPAQLRDRFVQ
jgi:hypothetical protein